MFGHQILLIPLYQTLSFLLLYFPTSYPSTELLIELSGSDMVISQVCRGVMYEMNQMESTLNISIPTVHKFVVL